MGRHRAVRAGMRGSGVLLAALVTVACGAFSTSTSGTTGLVSADTAAQSAGPHSEFSGPVDIGAGREIYLQCRGAGGPTVVLVSGLANAADIWSTPDNESNATSVVDDVATITRVCAYDRPGTTTATGPSRSTPVPQPISATDAAIDLDALLTASGERGPYVLAGHSFGGPIIRLYAGAHPTETAGLVLVDGLSEGLATRLTPSQLAVFEALNTPPPDSQNERLDTPATFRELRESAAAPAVPVIVLSADRPQLTPELLASGQLPAGVDQAFADALWAAQLAAQDELAALFPGATHVTSTNSSHYIQLDNPRLVVDSIREVVEIVRGSEPTG